MLPPHSLLAHENNSATALMKKAEVERLALPEYWDEKYAAEGSDKSFDWFRDFQSLRPFFEKHMPKRDARIIHLGCGNSVRASWWKFSG